LLYSLLTGCVLGLLTVAPDWYLDHHARPIPLWLLNLASIVAMPGLVAGYAANRNIHVANLWVAALVNFAFYFGLTYLVWAAWARLTAKSQ
jgi:hypothetical protein